MGISSGGYAAILFVSLCHIKNVISFVPRTNLKGIRGIVDNKYENLKNIILETINKKELTEDKKKNAKMLLHSIFDENKNFPKYLEILTK